MQHRAQAEDRQGSPLVGAALSLFLFEACFYVHFNVSFCFTGRILFRKIHKTALSLDSIWRFSPDPEWLILPDANIKTRILRNFERFEQL